MFEHEIERQETPHDDRLAGLSPVVDVLNSKRPVDRVARYPARLAPPPIEHEVVTLDRHPPINQGLYKTLCADPPHPEVMAELRQREHAALKAHERDPLRLCGLRPVP